MLSYSELYQQIVDDFAQKNENWQGGLYLGIWKVTFFNSSDDADDWLLFEPIERENEKPKLFHFILVNKTQIVLFRDTTNSFIQQTNLKRHIVLSKFKIVKQENIVIDNKPIRNSKFLQTIADNYVTNHGACAALFVGYYYGYAVYTKLNILYRPMVMASGAPVFVLVSKTGQIKNVQNFDDDYMGSFDIIDKLMTNTKMPWKRGERIYKKLMNKYENQEYDESEREYLDYLHSLDLTHWDSEKHNWLDKEKVFEYLEAANIIGEEIYIVDEPDIGVRSVAFKYAYKKCKSM